MAAGDGPTLDRATQEELFQGVLDAAGKSLERARGAGVVVQGAAAALGTLYTGILTFAFAVKDNPLPIRGFVPTVFFAAAVALAMFYTAYLTEPRRSTSPNYGTLTREELRMFKLSGLVRGVDSEGRPSPPRVPTGSSD